MPLPLPDLDDRRWSDLVDEGRSLIPRLAPAWTDYNVSDPGITLLDLLAWMTEADTFGIDRVPRAHRERFLALVGLSLRPAVPARTPVQFSVPSTTLPLGLPRGIVFTASTPDAAPIRHQLADAVTVLGCPLTSVQVWTGAAFIDRTQDWRHGTFFDALGPDPVSSSDPDGGAALLLGFDPSSILDPSARLSLWLKLDDAATAGLEGHPSEVAATAPHHSARTAWEYHDGAQWQPFAPADVVDETRALTRSGGVVLPFGATIGASSVLGAVPVARRWLRVRLVGGRHDVAPRASAVLADAALLVQAVPGCAVWPLAPGHDPLQAGVVVGAVGAWRVCTDALGRITALTAAAPGDPEVIVTSVEAQSVGLSLLLAGVADGAPSYAGIAPGGPFVGGETAVWTADASGTTAWTVVDTLLRSGPADRHVFFDPASGCVIFGDGERGRIPDQGSTVLVRAAQSAGVSGTPTMRTVWQLDVTDPRTHAITIAGPIDAATLSARAIGSDPALAPDDLEAGEGRAAERVWAHERLIEVVPPVTEATLDQLDRALVLARTRPERATTTLDFERMALEVPGTTVLRARAWAGLDPAMPRLSAPGTVTVVVVPGMPAAAPWPTAPMLGEVRRYLCARRTIGTRLVVTGPDYLAVSVTATATALPNVDTARVRADALAELYAFLHPLTGGPAARGWPFGRDVFQAEILRRLDLVDGLDHVESIELLADGRPAGCGNVCLGVTQLVVSGTHEVTVR